MDSMAGGLLLTVQGEGAPAAPAVVRMAAVVTGVPPAPQKALEHSWMATPGAADEVPETVQSLPARYLQGQRTVVSVV